MALFASVVSPGLIVKRLCNGRKKCRNASLKIATGFGQCSTSDYQGAAQAALLSLPAIMNTSFLRLGSMQRTITILAISNKGRSRIGKALTTAIVEQDKDDKLFIALPQFNQWRWIKKQNDPDFSIVTLEN